MRSIFCALGVLVHVRSSIAACDSDTCEQFVESAVSDDVASQGARETQPSLLQKTTQAGRTPPSIMQDQVKTTILQLPDVFLYDHLPKAGGSFIRGVLAGPDTLGKVIPEDHLRIITEADTLTKVDKQLSGTFTVGSVRNPCDYYVSCWSFFGQVLKTGGYGGEHPYGGEEYFGVSPELNTSEDQQRFGKWLRYSMPDGLEPGVLTARILWSYFNESVGNAVQPEPSMRGWSLKDRQVYAAAAAAFDPSSVDCWVKTETLTEDLRHCLTLYEDRVGPGIVNWKEFEGIIARQEQAHKQETFQSTNGDNLYTKNSGHPPCEFFFDKANTDFVLKTDRQIFSKFGYSKCCGAPDAPSVFTSILR